MKYFELFAQGQLVNKHCDMLLLSLTEPPSHPIIQGYTEATSIAAGTVQKISCISSGGNPLATLTWYKNDKKVSTALFCTIATNNLSPTYFRSLQLFTYHFHSFS
jgi:hypothetical protein